MTASTPNNHPPNSGLPPVAHLDIDLSKVAIPTQIAGVMFLRGMSMVTLAVFLNSLYMADGDR